MPVIGALTNVAQADTILNLIEGKSMTEKIKNIIRLHEQCSKI